MEDFFKQNIWASWLVIGSFIILSIYFYYKKVKKQIDEHPQSNVFEKLTVGKWSIILSILAIFVVLLLLSYFVLVPMFSINAEEELIRLQNDNTQNEATQFMNKFRMFFDFVYSSSKWRNLLLAVGSFIVLFSLILKKDNWLLTGDSSVKWTWGDFADIFGKKYIRILLIILFLALLIFGLIGFFNN